MPVLVRLNALATIELDRSRHLLVGRGERIAHVAPKIQRENV